MTAIDATAGSLTFQTESGASVTVTVTADTKLERNNAPAQLTDFAVGDRVEVKYDPNTFVASKIEANNEANDDNDDNDDNNQLAEIKGAISALGTNTVTITRRDGTSVTVTVTSNTRIERNDAPATFADLRVGDQAEAKFDPNTLEAFKLEAEGV